MELAQLLPPHFVLCGEVVYHHRYVLHVILFRRPTIDTWACGLSVGERPVIRGQAKFRIREGPGLMATGQS